MDISKRDVDEISAGYKGQYAGSKDDYFALLYLAREFEKPPDAVIRQVGLGEAAPEGIHAFYIDLNRRNLYLVNCQWSEQHQSFKGPLRRLAHEGMERIFGESVERPGRLLAELRDRIAEDQSAIDRVLVHFVYNGDPQDADQSVSLEALREDLETKRHLLDQCFGGRKVSLQFQFLSNDARARRGRRETAEQHRYALALADVISSRSDDGEKLHVGFIPVVDLYRMFREMGQRLFERNIRAGLDPDGPINKKIRAALGDVVASRAPASAFAFNHNGITIAAEQLEIGDRDAHIIEPRVLNGAQTITSLVKFIESADFEACSHEDRARLNEVRVLAKIVTNASQPFVTAVTINTNCQNPVEPANLRASDPIQLEFQDKFRDELEGLHYERQENSFKSMSDEELVEQGFDPEKSRAIEIKRLARTFLAAQGEMDRISRLDDVFETESQYRGCFSERYLKSDARRIVLAYKIQFRLNKVAREIDESANGYSYVRRAKNLLWALLIQGVLNSSSLPGWIESYGTSLGVEADFKDELVSLGVNKVRLAIRQAALEPKYKIQLDEDRLSFLKTKAFYTQCMDVAAERYGWTKQAL